MSALHSLVLAVLQGVTEFLPVSSSGHLALAQHLFNLEEQPLVFDVYLHFATMMATIVYFFFDIVGLLKEWILGCLFVMLNTSPSSMTKAFLAGTPISSASCLCFTRCLYSP